MDIAGFWGYERENKIQRDSGYRRRRGEAISKSMIENRNPEYLKIFQWNWIVTVKKE